MFGVTRAHVCASLVLVLFIVAMFAVAPPPKELDAVWINGAVDFLPTLSYDHMACISLFFSNMSYSLSLMHLFYALLLDALYFVLLEPRLLTRRFPIVFREARPNAQSLASLACHPHQAPPVLS